MRKVARAAVLLGSAAAMLFAAAPAGAAVTYESSFGSPGAGSGQFNNPSGVAVNEVTGDIYVVDRENFRVERFDHSGNFLSMWGRNVNATTNGAICTAASGNTCQAGQAGGAAGFFNSPRGVAVDNSGGPATGSVYVQDADNNRVQRFTAEGQFVLTWGKGVNATTGGNICTQASGNTCRAGEVSGDATTTPPVPSADGVFSGWLGYYGGRRDPDIGTDGDGYVYVGEGTAVPYPRVQKFDSSGTFLGKMAPPPTGAEYPIYQFTFVTGVAANADGEVFVSDTGESFNPAAFKRYTQDDFSTTGESAVIDSYLGGGAGVERPAIDPSNGFVFGLGPAGGCGGGSSGRAVFEFHPHGQMVDCTLPTSPSIGADGFGATGGTAVSPDHRLYVADTAADKVLVFSTPVATPPGISSQRAGEITSTKAVVKADIAANLGDTTYHLEYGPTPCSDVRTRAPPPPSREASAPPTRPPRSPGRWSG